MDISGKYLTKGRDVHCREIDLNSVLLDLDSGEYYSLNRVGTFIWSLINGKRDVSHIVDEVTGKFDISTKQAGLDVNGLIEKLIGEGLVEAHDKPE